MHHRLIQETEQPKRNLATGSQPRYLIYRFSHGDIHCFLGLVVVVYGKSDNASKEDSVNDADKLG